jgi:hypothetical protein
MTQTIINLGTGGAVLNGRNGSTAGADTNDALFLDWPGDNQGNYVYLPGVAANYLSVPDNANLQITGDIDIRAQLAMDSWTPASAQALVSKWLTTGNQRAYYLFVGTTGLLILRFSTLGSDAITVLSTAALGVSAGSVKWVRATLDVDNGASGYDVNFFTSDDGVTWTQLGSTVTGAGTTSIFAGNNPVFVGSLNTGTTEPLAGKVYRAQIWNGIEGSGGTKVLDIDTSAISSGSATSFTAVTSQTVTINRSTSGRRSVAVVAPVWLFGTDDYMEVANNALLNFGASDSFTILLVYRMPVQVANHAMLSTRTTITDSATIAGFTFRTRAAPDVRIVLDDVTNVDTLDRVMVAGDLTVLAVTADASTLTAYLNGAATSKTRTVGSLSTTLPFRIGRNNEPSSAYSSMELVSTSVYKRALSATEISAITSYYQARLS